MDGYDLPIDLEAIKRGSVVRTGALGTYQGPAILRASEAQRTAEALKHQCGGATFRIEPEKSTALKDWLEV